MGVWSRGLGASLLAMLIISAAVVTVPMSTQARTTIFKETRPGPVSSYPSSLTRAGGAVFFTDQYRNRNGHRLWRTRGTRSSTILLKRYRTWLGDFRSVEGTLLYWSDECWRVLHCDPLTSDGTRKGTGIKDPEIYDRVASRDHARLGGAYLFPSRGRLRRGLMRSDDGWASSGVEVYRYPGGPVEGMTRVGGAVYFVADDGVHGRELWRTDGTAAGTRLIKDLRPGSTGSNPHELTAVGNRLLFVATIPGIGRELWISDGTDAGTHPVRDESSGPQLSNLRILTPVDDRLFFVASDPMHGRELWVSDGTWKGTRLVRDIRRGPKDSVPTELTAVGDRLYFVANDGRHGRELWSSTGSWRSTKLVKDIQRGHKGSAPDNLTRLGRKLFFVAENRRHGRELWVHTR